MTILEAVTVVKLLLMEHQDNILCLQKNVSGNHRYVHIGIG